MRERENMYACLCKYAWTFLNISKRSWKYVSLCEYVRVLRSMHFKSMAEHLTVVFVVCIFVRPNAWECSDYAFVCVSMCEQDRECASMCEYKWIHVRMYSYGARVFEYLLLFNTWLDMSSGSRQQLWVRASRKLLKYCLNFQCLLLQKHVVSSDTQSMVSIKSITQL